MRRVGVLGKALFILIFFLSLFFLSRSNVSAVCWRTSEPYLECNSAFLGESCLNNSIGAWGRASYNCGNYDNPDDKNCLSSGRSPYGCMQHTFQCDTPCGSPGVPGSGGGGGFSCPLARVDCPRGAMLLL